MNLYQWCGARIAQSVLWLTTGWKSRVSVPVGAGFISFPYHPHWFWDPPRLLCNGYQVLSRGGRWPGRSILILYFHFHLGLPNYLSLSGSPNKFVCISLVLHILTKGNQFLSRAKLSQSIYSHPILLWFILILSFHHPSSLSPSGSPSKFVVLHVCYVSHLIFLLLIILILDKEYNFEAFIMQFSAGSCHFLPLRAIYSSQHHSLTPSIFVLPLIWRTIFYTHINV